MSCACPLCGQAIVDDGRVLVDIEGGLVVAGGHVVQLTRQEFALFEALWRAKLRLQSKEQLLDALYGLLPEADMAEIKIIDVFVHKLRKKLKPTGVVIETLWGRGYRFVTPGTQHEAAALPAGSTLQEVA